MNTTLGDILSEAQIITDLRAKDRWEAIDELITNLVQTGKIKAEDRDPIIGAIRKREFSMSTGIGFGIGIPHASTELVHKPVAAFGRSKRKIKFDSLDGKPVSLVILFLVPQGQFQKHLHTMAEIAKLLKMPIFGRRLNKPRMPRRCSKLSGNSRSCCPVPNEAIGISWRFGCVLICGAPSES